MAGAQSRLQQVNPMKSIRESFDNGTAGRMNLRLLEIFVRVAQAGSMSAAGQSLGISQAAVSQAVTAFEEALGAQLFDRSVRPPALTLAGNAVLKPALEAVRRLQEVQDAARYAASGRVPLLRIGMLDSFTSTAGPGTLQRIKDLANEWTVTSGFGATGLQAIIERRCDVIITSDDQPVPDHLVAATILREDFVLALPPGWKGDQGDLPEIARQLSFIRYGRDSHMGSVIDRHLEKAGLQVNTRYQFNTTDALLRMVAAGFGWTVVTPLVLLKSVSPETRVRIAALPGGTLRRRLAVIVRRGEGEAILDRVRDAATDTLTTEVRPALERLLPDLGDRFVIGGGTSSRPRRRSRTP
jgi:DNA-binding transcriptional LysR family regulator